ncbi:Peroxisomal targeting signal 2 receptor [Smittium mucronatum]|uniref:Peroxin-7 n=1 Tax=Smittium mucronatum TaxID=133383 RepID=A0A1R0H7Q6_9FUNG|nr:Peroxisomal targeting signal 2 receptor [Smittium mucronatum]
MQTLSSYRSRGYKGYSSVQKERFGSSGKCKFWPCRKRYDTNVGIYDTAWSEVHENQLVTCGVDGSIMLYDINIPGYPVAKWNEHSREAMSVNWNYISKDVFLSSSWDSSIKLWSPNTKTSLKTITQHQGCVYDTAWNPKAQPVFASCSEDKLILLHDLRQFAPTLSLAGHNDQVLSLDWNKYDNNLIISCSSDKSIRVWDTRSPKFAVTQFGPFEFPSKKVVFSPHQRDIAASCGYDMGITFWNLPTMLPISRYSHHSEFVFGLDWNLFYPNIVASYSWDESINLIRV